MANRRQRLNIYLLMISIRKILTEAVDAPPPAVVRSIGDFSPKFIEYIKAVENGQKIGFKNGIWYWHPAPEGGNPEIGYGHKIKKGEESKFAKGLSNSEVERLLKTDLGIAKKQVYSDIKRLFKVQVPLDQVQEEILVDYAFNLGSLQDFPKFTRAVLNKDWDTAKKEYIRTYKDARGKTHTLGRNKIFFNTFLKDLSSKPTSVKEEVGQTSSNIEFIRDGLVELSHTTHLVGQQLKDNIDEYVSNFDDDRFSHKIGTITKFLGSGVFGAVFQLSSGKTFKMTFYFREAPFLYVYCYKSHTPGFVEIDEIYEDDFGKTQCFYIVREPIKKIGPTTKVDQVINDYKNGGRNLTYNDPLKDGVSKSLQTMYNMDGNWRGTHSANLAIQNGQVVLFDGFSKKATPQASIEKF